jgi:hypothetical protein
MIEDKVQGKLVVETAAPAHKAQVIDIMEALKMSLAESKKPVASVKPEPAMRLLLPGTGKSPREAAEARAIRVFRPANHFLSRTSA